MATANASLWFVSLRSTKRQARNIWALSSIGITGTERPSSTFLTVNQLQRMLPEWKTRDGLVSGGVAGEDRAHTRMEQMQWASTGKEKEGFEDLPCRRIDSFTG